MSKNRNFKRFQERKAKARAELETIGKEIAERVKKMRDYEATAQEKAGVELKNAKDQRDTITGVLLVQAKAKCKVTGESFKEFQAKYCPDLSRSRLYEILAIADGRKTREQVQAATRDRTAKSRANKVSATSSVADEEPSVTPGPAVGMPKDGITRTLLGDGTIVTEKVAGNAGDPVEEGKAMSEKMAALDDAPTPTELGAYRDTPEKKSARILMSGKSWIDEYLNDMTTADKLALFEYFKLHNAMVGVKRRAV